MLKKAETLVHVTEHYTATIDPSAGRARVCSAGDPDLSMDLGLCMAIDSLGNRETLGGVIDASFVEDSEHATMRLELKIATEAWAAQTMVVEFGSQSIAIRATVQGSGQRIAGVRGLLGSTGASSTTSASELYVPRFDWFEAQVRTAPGESERISAQQWLSPPPLVYVLEGTDAAFWLAAAARVDELDFVSFDWSGADGCSTNLTYEGHTEVQGSFTTPALVIGVGPERGNAAVDAAVTWQRDRGIVPDVADKEIPAWWREPIFCGWGQMRYDYRADHQGHENGNFINVTSYCTELRYRNYLSDLDARGIDPGTIVIDMGWAQDPALAAPHPHRWSDMRAFIDEQHERGRRVLLWFAPSVAQGLPRDACMTLDGRPIAPDITSPEYQAILREQIRLMVSEASGCLNADGFKIDFTQCYPSEDGTFVSGVENFAGLINDSDDRYLYPRLREGRTELIQTHAPRWGIGLIRDHIGLIYETMKAVKPDAALMTHTANPSFADVVDILRLNDLDGECSDVLGVMSNRAELARISCAAWLIDTDDDLMIDRDRWLAYARLQPTIGIPDTYYATAIAASGESLRDEDWAEVRDIWASYRATLPRE